MLLTISNSQVIQSRVWQIQNQQLKELRRISRQNKAVNKSRKSRFRNAIKKMNLILEKK